MNKLFIEGKDYLATVIAFSDADCDGAASYKSELSELKKSYWLLISFLYNSPLSNFLIIKARCVNFPTLLISDGVIEWSNMFNNPLLASYNLNLYHPIIHDAFLCVGKDETEYFNFLGTPTVQFLPERMKPTIPRVGKNGNFKFLITTANTAYFNDEERDLLLSLLVKIQSKLDDNNLEYVFRIFDSYLQSQLGLYNNKKNMVEGGFEDCLKEVDFVITTPSSISFLAMYHGKPLAHLIYRDSPQFIQAGWNITSLVSLESTINSMKSYDHDRMCFQEYQVSKYVADNDSIITEIQESLEKKREDDFKKFVDQNLFNMLNSRFNINFEYIARKIYLKFKRKKFFQYLRTKIH